MLQFHSSWAFFCLSPEVVNKSVLPLLMFSFIAVLTLKLVLEMAEHAL